MTALKMKSAISASMSIDIKPLKLMKLVPFYFSHSSTTSWTKNQMLSLDSSDGFLLAASRASEYHLCTSG
jgi:hypothetical protein